MAVADPDRRARRTRSCTSALEEYTEHGWAGFTMDGVARRAGFGKSTLYLRWADKDALLTDAVRLRTRVIARGGHRVAGG